MENYSMGETLKLTPGQYIFVVNGTRVELGVCWEDSYAILPSQNVQDTSRILTLLKPN